MSALFISDLHLSPDRPEKLEAFKQLLNGPGKAFQSVYILGDLFEEFWIGNDDTTPPIPDIINALKSFSQYPENIFFIRGNRELLLEKSFKDITGVTVLPDKAVIEINKKKVLIMHGDQLCTLDWRYQLFRKIMTNKLVQALIKTLPYRFRILIAHGLRPGMTRDKKSKPYEIMDVTNEAVTKIMGKYNVSILIHGHTHKPGIHQLHINNQPAQRIVLGDWYRRGEILVCEGNEMELKGIDDFLDQF